MLTSFAFVLTGLVSGVAAVPASAAAPSASAASGIVSTNVAGQPGTPSDPVTLWIEDFETGTPDALGLEDYTGGNGEKYTADPYWLNQNECNGIVMSYNSGTTEYCPETDGGRRNLQRLADVLGQHRLGVVGSPDKTTPVDGSTVGSSADTASQANRAVSAFTNKIEPTGTVEFRTKDNLPLTIAGTGSNKRFLGFSVDVAELSCEYMKGANNSTLQFSLVEADGTELVATGAPIRACTDTNSRYFTSPYLPGSTDWDNGGTYAAAGHFNSPSAVLVDGGAAGTTASFGVIMRNLTQSAEGNDHAFDNVSVFDATPQLDKSFLPTSVVVGADTRLTFTVTNTSELGAKQGWSFTDKLPSGLVVSGTPDTATSCTNGVVSAPANGTSLSVVGDLDGGQVSCTASVNVTSSTPTGAQPSPKSYQNCAANIEDAVGLDLPNCATVEFFSTPALVLSKTSDATVDTRVGDTVNYTVTAKNTGNGDFTAADPASVVDDLGGVLDDADYNGDATADKPGAVSFGSPRLSWVGELAAGETVTLTYTVTVKSGGDGTVRNVAFAPADPTNPGTTPACDFESGSGIDPVTGRPCATTQFELPRLSIEKSADTTELPAVGGVVNYTVVAKNEGPGSYSAESPANVVDDLTAVLDDATFDVSSLDASPQGTLDYSVPRITWSGALAAGASVTLNYTVKYTGAGDKTLVNVAFGPSTPNTTTPKCNPRDSDGLDPVTGEPCARVRIPGAALVTKKSVNPASGSTVNAGEVLSYELSFSNEGAAAATVDHVDVLAGVLDDADVTSAPSSSDAGLTVSEISDGRYSIYGTVAPGSTTTVNYQVTVKADGTRGNNVLANFLLPEGTEPPTTCLDTNDNCTTNPVPEVSVVKSVDPASGSTVTAGTDLTYTLTFANVGQAAGAVAFDDVLSGVLDDATMTSVPASSDAALIVTPVTDGRFSVAGSLAAGATVTVSYTVTVKADGERGDNTLANFVVPEGETPDPEEPCVVGSELCTVNYTPLITSAKSVDPVSGTAVVSGKELSYTLTFTNSGTGAGSFSRVDDLSGILDDATITAVPTSSDAAVSVSEITDGRFSIEGTLAAGASVTVSYTVTVNAAEDLGDTVLKNFLLKPDDETPEECVEGSVDCTNNPVGVLDVTKSVAPKSGTAVGSGDKLVYTLSFTNTGVGSVEVDYTDHLAGVLDDADISSAPVASGDALLVSGPTNKALQITGTLTAQATVTVTYTVTVKAWADQGDHLAANFLTVTGAEPPANCVVENPLCTENPIQEIPAVIAHTGIDGMGAGFAAALILLMAGMGAFLFTRKRHAAVEGGTRTE